MNDDKKDVDNRPKIGDPMALFWVLGYLSARQKEKRNCPYRSDLKSSKIWNDGFTAGLTA